jgi:hypothetical protein
VPSYELKPLDLLRQFPIQINLLLRQEILTGSERRSHRPTSFPVLIDVNALSWDAFRRPGGTMTALRQNLKRQPRTGFPSAPKAVNRGWQRIQPVRVVLKQRAGPE